MGSRSGTSKKKKAQNQPRFYKKISAQDGLDGTNNDSTESSNQLSAPPTGKTSPISRHSQTPSNPQKRIRTDDSSEEENYINDLLIIITNK